MIVLNVSGRRRSNLGKRLPVYNDQKQRFHGGLNAVGSDEKGVHVAVRRQTGVGVVVLGTKAPTRPAAERWKCQRCAHRSNLIVCTIQ